MADLDNLLGGLDQHQPEDDNNLGKENRSYEKQSMGNKDTSQRTLDDGELDTQQDEYDNTGESISPYERLKRAWMQELACPELLPYDDEVIAYFMNLLSSQEDDIEQIQQHGLGNTTSTSNTNNTVSNTNIRQSSATHAVAQEANQMISALSINIMKMEMDRVRFMLTDLLRARLWKLETYALYNRKIIDRMSDDEVRDELREKRNTNMMFVSFVRFWVSHTT
jgi:hypothetical protein